MITIDLRTGLLALLAAGAVACEVGMVGTLPSDEDDGAGDMPGEEHQPGTPPPTDPALHSILVGTFEPVLGVTGVGGRAQLVRTLDGKTRVDVSLAGVPAGHALTAHVHIGPCAYQGASHYKIQPAVAETVETNELWLHVTATPDGLGAAAAEFAHQARGDALSVVVHDTDGAKLACADLDDGQTEVDYGGDLTPLALVADIDRAIAGAVVATRAGDRTELQLDLTGLDPASIYGAHVHALPCAITDGGGHYKLDPTIVDPVETNELWFNVLDHPAGTAGIPLATAHALRADAQSIVLHRTIVDQKPKVACADLVRLTPYAPIERTGPALPLPDATARNLSISGSATIVRSLADVTIISAVISGLEPDLDYTAHVHDLPCSVQVGGAHYRIDPTLDSPDNELALTLPSSSSGLAATSTWFPHLVRSSARSLVVHDPADGARLTCIDL